MVDSGRASKGPACFIRSVFMEITRDTIVGDIVNACPEAMPGFQEIGMHCMGCAMASGETVEQACAAHGVDPDEFLEYLTQYLKNLS